jgi:hypothetical protein
MRYQTPPQRVKGQLIGDRAQASCRIGQAALRLGTIGEAIGALERELARESPPEGRDTPGGRR